MQQGDILSGRYRLTERLGEGGFSRVYKALDRQTGATVAVKVLHGQHAEDRALVERFERGVRAMMRLSHPNIVRVLDGPAADGGRPYFVMEYLDGGDLRRAVRSERLTRARALEVVAEVGPGLAHAHAQGCLHRGIKPQNILLGRDGSVRLADFDLAHLAGPQGGARLGTLGAFVYVPPEELSSAGEVGPQGDVFSLAMTAIFVAHGKDLPLAALAHTPLFLRTLPGPSRLIPVLERATRWEPEERFPSVEAFCAAFNKALHGRDEVEVQDRPTLLALDAEAEGQDRPTLLAPDAEAEGQGAGHLSVETRNEEHLRYRHLGKKAMADRRYALAERLYRAALDFLPSSSEAKLLLAQAIGAQGRGAEAEAILRDLVAERPKESVVHVALVDLLTTAGRLDEALVFCRESLIGFPDNPELRARLRNLHARQRQDP